MTAFNENNLNDRNENLRNLRQGENANADQVGDNIGISILEDNPYSEAENPAGNGNYGATIGDSLNREKGYGTDPISNIAPGPGDEDDLDDDDDDLLDDDDDDTLIPIEGDDEDDGFLSADDDDDVIPGTDMDDDDMLDDDDDLDDDSSVNRSTTGNIGTDFSRNDGRTTGRMIDHEPGTGGI
ncbi:MAG TPA: hypothetical protein VLZ28_01345 [Daejeonella sp.]|nr:hypothetical protein [Daejeonella sp.]